MVNYNILWIEDDALILECLVAPLKEEGHVIEIALNLDEAKEKLSSRTYDLILLDMVFPSGLSYRTVDDLKLNRNKKPGLIILEIIDNFENKPPVFVFSVVTDPIVINKIREFKFVVGVITKGGIRPSVLKDSILSHLTKSNKY